MLTDSPIQLAEFLRTTIFEVLRCDNEEREREGEKAKLREKRRVSVVRLLGEGYRRRASLKSGSVVRGSSTGNSRFIGYREQGGGGKRGGERAGDGGKREVGKR